MQTKEINKISIKPVVHLALESHEILVMITSRRFTQIFIYVQGVEAVKQHLYTKF